MSQTSAPDQSAKRERTFWFTMARIVTRILTHTVFPTRWHIPDGLSVRGPAIVVSNHKHWLDPLLVGVKIKDQEIRFLGKKELVKTKIGEKLLTRLHMIVVDRHNSDLKAMRDCVNTVRQGHVLGIFPEGTRCRDTTMEHLETGCALIALRCKATVYPVLIDRPCRLFRRVNVYFGQPLVLDDLYEASPNGETAEEMNRRIRESVLSLGPIPS